MRGIELEASKPPVTEETPDEKALDLKPLFQPIETVYAAKRENEKFDAWAKKWIAETDKFEWRRFTDVHWCWFERKRIISGIVSGFRVVYWTEIAVPPEAGGPVQQLQVRMVRR